MNTCAMCVCMCMYTTDVQCRVQGHLNISLGGALYQCTRRVVSVVGGGCGVELAKTFLNDRPIYF